MTQLIETATFEALVLRPPRGKFESVEAPLLLMHSCSAPFGVELDTLYSPLPTFAGGSDPRKHLTLQLEVSDEAAAGLARLDEACEALSLGGGEWSPSVKAPEGRGRNIVKVRIHLEGERATCVRSGEGELKTGWEHLGPILLQQANLRGRSLKVAIRPQYVWSVSGKRGLTLAVDQLVIIESEQALRVDHFA